MRHISPAKALICGSMLLALTACNEDSTRDPYSDSATLAVTGFTLKSDPHNVGLDSVYFAIDLGRSIIYNPDSLRPGTPINKIIPVITYPSEVDRAVITMTGGTTRTGEVNYKTNPTDSIDFTGKVSFTLAIGSYEHSYDIKINVHKEYADSLRWSEADVAPLPSRMANPKAQKTVRMSDSSAVCMILESDGSYTLARSRDMYDNSWSKSVITLPFTPRLNTLTAAGDDLYMLATDGALYKGNVSGTWSATGQVWESMIGAYTETVVGLESKNGSHYFAQYPVTNLNVKQIPEDFPVSGFSNFVTLTNKWTLSPVAFFQGGLKADGTLSPATWAFDGSEWILLNNGDIPAMEQASLIPYYYYRPTASGNGMEEYNVWMLIGGRKEDNSINRTVYMTYDNGVNWRQGSAQLQLPEVMPDMWNCDNVVQASPKTADISANWTRMWSAPATRMDYTVDGTNITWQCPYIYLIGGTDANGRLCNTIWRGVLARLTFTPII